MTQQKLFEHLQRDPVFVQWNRVGRYIAERQLSDQEISSLFGNIQQNMTAAGQNRTAIGRGVDTAKGAAQSVSSAWASLKDKIYNSGPMSGFATAYDRAAESLKQATGGDQGLFQYVQKYRDFAEKHPIMQKAVYAALVSAAGMVGAAGGPAGIGAAVGLMQTFDKALQGQDIRSAIYSGTKAGVTAAGAATLASYLRGGDAAAGAAKSADTGIPSYRQAVGDVMPDGSTVTDLSRGSLTTTAATPDGGTVLRNYPQGMPGVSSVPASQLRQQIFSQAQQAVNDAVQQGITDPSKLTDIAARAVDNLPASISTQTAIDKAVTSGLGQVAKAAGGQAALTQGQLVRESFDRVSQVMPLILLPRPLVINRDATVMQWSLNESLGNKTRSVQLTDQGISAIFENLALWRAVILESDAPSAQKLRYHWNQPVNEAPLTAFGTVGAARAARLAQAAAAQKPSFFSRAWSGIKGAAQKAGQAASAAGAELTTKVTANRLQSNWNKVKEYDSDKLADWLVKAPQSVPREVVADVYGKMGIPVPAGLQTAPAAAAPAAAAPAAAAPAAAAPAAAAPTKLGKKATSTAQQQYKQQSRDERLAKQGYTKGGAADIAASSSAAPTEKKVAREIDAEIDDLIRALRKVDSIAAPAYVKYIRDRLDQTFGPATAAAPAPKKTISRKSKTAPQPKMQVVKGGTAPAPETMSIGGQKLNPKDPKDAELIARARAAGAVAEDLVWSKHWDPTQRLLKGLAHDQ